LFYATYDYNHCVCGNQVHSLVVRYILYAIMENLVENTLEIEIIADMLLIGGRLSEWKRRKPTEEMQEMSLAFARLVCYVNKLQLEKKAFDIAIRNVKKNKNEQIEGWKLRAEKAEQKLENPLNL
jgi:hypothetical protein